MAMSRWQRLPPIVLSVVITILVVLGAVVALGDVRLGNSTEDTAAMPRRSTNDSTSSVPIESAVAESGSGDASTDTSGSGGPPASEEAGSSGGAKFEVNQPPPAGASEGSPEPPASGRPAEANGAEPNGDPPREGTSPRAAGAPMGAGRGPYGGGSDSNERHRAAGSFVSISAFQQTGIDFYGSAWPQVEARLKEICGGDQVCVKVELESVEPKDGEASGECVVVEDGYPSGRFDRDSDSDRGRYVDSRSPGPVTPPLPPTSSSERTIPPSTRIRCRGRSRRRARRGTARSRLPPAAAERQ